MTSVAVARNVPERRPSFQPFQCQVCQSRFTRHENLKRHAALHARSQHETSLACEFCPATFSRSDLRQRHIKRKHPEHQANRPKKRQMLRKDISLSTSPSAIDVGLPSIIPEEQGVFDPNMIWHTALEHDQQQPDISAQNRIRSDVPSSSETAANLTETQSSINTESVLLDTSRPRLNLQPKAISSQPSPLNTAFSIFSGFNQSSPSGWFSAESPQVQDDWCVSITQRARGCELFFDHVTRYLPFIHQPTFNASQTDRRLLLGMISLGYQYGEDPDCGELAGSGARLSIQCFHQARALLAADNDEEVVDTLQSTTTVQACLLLQVLTMMYICGSASAYGLKTHSKIVALARAGGLMRPVATEATTTTDLDSLWHHFIQAEAHKRTCFALHQIDALWYQVLSIPRSLSHLEIKHELPCPEDHWRAASSREWAHGQLLLRQTSPTVQYPEVVRQLLSSNADLYKLPPFDPYGTINITQFLISSAREISGWSTITGILSIERVEPLRSSLVALEPFTRSFGSNSDPTHASLAEIAWETAMIELQMWSPTHTGGIIEGSMNAVLRQLTDHAPSCEFLCESRIANLVQPHVDWFLRYLDATFVPDTEAPWVVLYAYKAFVIAWQLVQYGAVGSMQAVGVQDGDTQGALVWARKVFGRRARWQLGKIVMQCIDTLEAGTSPG